MEKSYSTITRLELAKNKFGQNKQLLAELAGFAFAAGNIHIGRGKFLLELTSETEEVAVRIVTVLNRLYKSAPQIRVVEKSQPKKHVCFSIDVKPEQPEGQMLFDIGFLEGTRDDYSFSDINEDVFADEGCFEAALRGAFLGCGVLCDPQKSYRLDFVLSNEAFADFILNGLLERNIQAKKTSRNDRIVVYIKQIESISDVLIFIGASAVMMEIENVRVYKDVKNKLNRTGNCFVGNMGKTLDASQKQIEDIKFLYESKIKMSAALKEACELRLNNPEASLQELSEISGNISKSALNKRFIKIRELRNSIN